MPKVALVTGCSTGIGLSTAVLLGEAGWTVVATMRDPDKSGPLEERAEGAGVALDVRALDVSDEASILRCVEGVTADHGRIDLLVNNAGFGAVGSVEQLPDEILRDVMETNFFGVWTCTRAVMPGMRERGSGRIVSVTSVGGLVGQPFNEAYCASKFAVEGMMEGLAPLARRFGVHVSLVEPGPVLTPFVDSVRAKAPVTLAGDIPGYAALAAAYLGASRGVFAEHGQSADDVGALIVAVAETEEPHLRYQTSDYVRDLAGLKAADPTGGAVRAWLSARLDGRTD